ncbi:hypothetical protein PR048_003402 [Dryococelus australis]|uniref:Uncharacterized protein n=1 Tax=Dryococelus australis TaxID=614101 RepID=A0ABQ9ING3_9NEOP|nr:hypothetical protein PR048_003402 [Dryococelus australis]
MAYKIRHGRWRREQKIAHLAAKQQFTLAPSTKERQGLRDSAASLRLRAILTAPTGCATYLFHHTSECWCRSTAILVLELAPRCTAFLRTQNTIWKSAGLKSQTLGRQTNALDYSAVGPFNGTRIRGVRGKSLESLEDGTERTHHTFSAENTQTFYYQQQLGWRPRSYDDGDITPTNEAVVLHEGGGTLPRPRGLVRPRPVAKIPAKTRSEVPSFEKPAFCSIYKSLPRDLIDISKYNLEPYSYVGDMPGGDTPKKRPPSPPKRQSSRGEADVVIDCSGPVPTATNTTTVTVDLHSSAPSPCSLPLPAYPSSPPPVMSRSWGNVSSSSGPDLPSMEHELLSNLSLQQSRNGSDASFKSSSSTESDSLPFANENAGTIKQRVTRPHPTLTTVDYPKTEFVPPQKRPQNPQGEITASQKALRERTGGQEPADVLNDIGNMLANLTDELDAMLEEEKRQGLNHSCEYSVVAVVSREVNTITSSAIASKS